MFTIFDNFNVSNENLTNELLSALLQDWRDDYKYEIDGVICIDDKLYPRKKGNPEHAFAGFRERWKFRWRLFPGEP